MAVWTPSIPFVSGSYPNQVIPYTDVNLLKDNALMQFKPVLAYQTTTPPTSITEATSGTWTLLDYVQDYSHSNGPPLVPLLVQFTTVIASSAAVSNAVLFAWFDGATQIDGVHARYVAGDTLRHLIVLNKWLHPTSSTISLKWQIEKATPNLTVGMSQGYRMVAVPL